METYMLLGFVLILIRSFDVRWTPSDFISYARLISELIITFTFFGLQILITSFENILNYSYVKGVNEIIEIHNSSDFVLNTRITKYILQLNDNDINYFLKNVKPSDLKTIILSSSGNKYDKISKYTNNFKKIINLRY